MSGDEHAPQAGRRLGALDARGQTGHDLAEILTRRQVAGGGEEHLAMASP